MKKRTKPKPAAMPWRVVTHERNVHVIHFDEAKGGNWEQWVLLQSDEHFDNPHCDRTTYARHLDEALARKAPVIKYGDLFCAMQGKWDKRGNKDSVREEDNNGNYLDSIVNHCVAWHRPYAPVLAILGPGNHETSILKRHETNLTERFVEQLHAKEPSTPLAMGGFSGWVRFRFTMHGTTRQSVRLWYHHGYGGGGPVTRGVIQTNRRAVYVEADIIATGHTHDQWIVPIERIKLNDANNQSRTTQLHITTPGYKDEYADGHGGWHIERGGPPKPIGAVWLRFWVRGNQIHYEAKMAT
jgi:hypothetical protein